jgi:hypothetical protein
MTQEEINHRLENYFHAMKGSLGVQIPTESNVYAS